MQVSALQAISEGMVTDRNGNKLASERFLGKSSIDLTLRSVITRSENGHPVGNGTDVIKGVSISYHARIEPQETVYIVSEERVSVPAGYVAYVFLKNRFSQRGLLAFNTGIVDGGYNGPIATLLTNISAQSIDLKDVNEGRFFRVVFHRIDMNDDDLKAVKNKSYDYDSYLNFKAKELLMLPQYFQNPDKIKSQIEESLNEKALNFGVMKFSLIIGFAGILMVLAPPLTELITKNLFGVEPLNKSLWELKNAELEKRITELERKITTNSSVSSKEGEKLFGPEKVNNTD